MIFPIPKKETYSDGRYAVFILRFKKRLFGDVKRYAKFFDDIEAVARFLHAESVHGRTELHRFGQNHGR